MDTIKDDLGPSLLNKGFVEPKSTDSEDGETGNLKVLSKFFKEQIDKLDTKLSKDISLRLSLEDLVNSQLVGSLFGSGESVANLIEDYLQISKILVPEMTPKVTTVLETMANVRSCNSKFSLKSTRF